MGEIDDAMEFGRRQRAEQESQANDERERREVVNNYITSRDRLWLFSDCTDGAAALAKFVVSAEPLELESKIKIAISTMRTQESDSYRCPAALLQMALDGKKRSAIASAIENIDGEAGLLERVKKVFCEVQGDLSPYHPITHEIDTPEVRARFEAEQRKKEHVVTTATTEMAPKLFDQRTAVQRRNDLFREWYHTEGTETFRSPATIRDKWNKEHPAEKISAGTPGCDTVNKGIKESKARAEKPSS